MKCVYFYVLALTLAFPRDVRHVCPVVESVTSWGARCTRRVRVVPDVPLTLNKRKRARELLSQHIFGHSSIVFCNCTETEDEILESVQRRAFKIITGGIVRTPTNNLYNEIGMETLKVRRERHVLLFFFKIIHNMVPSYLQELKPDKKKSGRYTFRTKNDFVEPDWRITKYQKSFLPFAISLWNRLDENTRKITNYESFKDTLMANTIDNPLFYVGSRQEQIIMAKLRMGGSNLNGHLYSMKLIDSPACSCGFINENEFHFFLVCPLYNRPRVTLQNAMGNIAPFTLRTLLYGSENLDLTVNKRIVTETLRFIKDSKRFDP